MVEPHRIKLYKWAAYKWSRDLRCWIYDAKENCYNYKPIYTSYNDPRVALSKIPNILRDLSMSTYTYFLVTDDAPICKRYRHMWWSSNYDYYRRFKYGN